MPKRSQAARVNDAKVYDDFPPKSEWRKEQDKHILTVHIPGFTKDQIDITCTRSTRKLQVKGERQLEINRWSRFNQSFPIPENFNLEKLEAWWQKGVLTITMPKEERKVPPEEDSAPPVPSKEAAPDKPSNDTQEAPPEAVSVNKPISSINIGERQADNELISTYQMGGDETAKSQGHEINEGDSKFIINLGMAFLVIMLLVACLSHMLGSKGQNH